MTAFTSHLGEKRISEEKVMSNWIRTRLVEPNDDNNDFYAAGAVVIASIGTLAGLWVLGL